MLCAVATNATDSAAAIAGILMSSVAHGRTAHNQAATTFLTGGNLYNSLSASFFGS